MSSFSSSCASPRSRTTSSTVGSPSVGSPTVCFRLPLTDFCELSVKQLREALVAERRRNSQREQELQQQLAAERAMRLNAEQRLAAKEVPRADQKKSDLIKVLQQLHEEMSKRQDMQKRLLEKEKQLMDAKRELFQKEVLTAANSRDNQKDQELQQQAAVEQAVRLVSDLVKVQKQYNEETLKRLDMQKRLHQKEQLLVEAWQQLAVKDIQLEEFRLQAQDSEQKLQQVWRDHQVMQNEMCHLGQVIKATHEVRELKEKLSEEDSTKQAVQQKVIKKVDLGHQSHMQLLERDTAWGETLVASTSHTQRLERPSARSERHVASISHMQLPNRPSARGESCVTGTSHMQLLRGESRAASAFNTQRMTRGETRAATTLAAELHKRQAMEKAYLVVQV